MGQRAGETEQKLWPSVETCGIHYSSDGRPASRICTLGQNQRQTGFYFSMSLMEKSLFTFVVWQTRFPTQLLFSCLSVVLPTATLPVWHPVPERNRWPVWFDPSSGPVIRPSAKLQPSRDGPLLCSDQGQRSKHIPAQAQDLLMQFEDE